mmetsp:Transcript_4726/g.10712  ORF Transcript_4726/g.10712 Transcript_4726/m.10712 type:complete len:87 (-) Transcript_4726:426-686(-)
MMPMMIPILGRLRVVGASRNSGNENEEGFKTHQPGVTIAYALDQHGKDGIREKIADEILSGRECGCQSHELRIQNANGIGGQGGKR